MDIYEIKMQLHNTKEQIQTYLEKNKELTKDNNNFKNEIDDSRN